MRPSLTASVTEIARPIGRAWIETDALLFNDDGSPINRPTNWSGVD